MEQRVFSKTELAFFAVPRTWREIEMRFGQEAKTEPFRDTIILADDEGGSGMLHYMYPEGQWVLTDQGKKECGARVIARELRIYPDSREQEAAGETFNEAMMVDAFSSLLEAPGPIRAPAVETEDDELARLIAEQEDDDDS